MKAARAAAPQPFREIVAFKHLGQRDLGGQAYEILSLKSVQPFVVVLDDRLFGIQQLEDLRFIGFGVGLYLLASERRASRVAPRRIADHRREDADQEDHIVPKLLKSLHLADDNRVAQMQIGSGGIASELDAQLAARRGGAFELLLQL